MPHEAQFKALHYPLGTTYSIPGEMLPQLLRFKWNICLDITPTPHSDILAAVRVWSCLDTWEWMKCSTNFHGASGCYASLFLSEHLFLPAPSTAPEKVRPLKIRLLFLSLALFALSSLGFKETSTSLSHPPFWVPSCSILSPFSVCVQFDLLLYIV